MAETSTEAQAAPKEVVGEVVSNKMAEDDRGQSDPQEGASVLRPRGLEAKKFYAHDEKNEAHVGDVVRLEETRPLSKLKRWKLKEIVRKTALVPEAPRRKSTADS